MRTVLADERSQPIHILNGQGEETHVGDVVSVVYKGEKVQRHSFRPRNTDKLYSLGATMERFKIVDHPTVLRPFLDSGYRIVKQRVIKNGLALWTQLEPENPVRVQDLITWDRDQWLDSTRVTPHELHESIIAITSATPKKGHRFQRGWFRLVCTNGLVAEVLNLGSLRMNHNQWSLEKLETWVNRTQLQGRSLGQEEVMGPVIGTKRGVERFRTVINDYLLARGDDEEAGAEQVINNVPLFIRDSVATLARQPRWFLENVRFQTEQFMDHGRDDRMKALDLVNTFTNPINQTPQGHTSNRSLMMLPALVKSSTQLIGAMSIN